MVDAITARSQALLSELSSINQVNSQQQLPEDQIHSVHTSWRWIIFHEFRKIFQLLWSSFPRYSFDNQKSTWDLSISYFLRRYEKKCWSSHQTAFRQWPTVLRAVQQQQWGGVMSSNEFLVDLLWCWLSWTKAQTKEKTTQQCSA